MQACITQAAKHSSLKPVMQHHPVHCHTAMPQRRTKGHHGAERPELSVCCEEEDTEALPTLGRTESKGRHRAPAAAAAAQAQAAPAVGASRNVTSNTGWQPTSTLYRCYHGGNSKSSSSLCKRSAHENRKASVHAPATQLQLKGLLCQVGPLCVVQPPHIVCRGTAAGQQRAVSNKRALHCAAKIQAVAGQAGRQACLGQCWAGTDGHRTCSATQPPLQHSINSLA